MTELPMSEASLQRCVTDLATVYGIWWWHDTDSRKNKAGLPDLLFVSRRGVMWAELKTEKGRFRAAQAETIDRFRAAGQVVHIWRPSDWRSGRIRQELEAIR